MAIITPVEPETNTAEQPAEQATATQQAPIATEAKEDCGCGGHGPAGGIIVQHNYMICVATALWTLFLIWLFVLIARKLFA